ncbi:nucleoside kinase [Bacteroidales bacterium OttesenSCG-928-K03]|nr:nucleoside kinase [Bacteroidales bacterium OttesenSCG-928-L14]MDL2240262.1 nucleoside kinase [Bacteroidales bacterium OttesenSCG-928-K22]MDL2242784.1 nucleoside kinase [Bacteroidales bacterium OttesenSCG-928-K03]
MKHITIKCENNNVTKDYLIGTDLQYIAQDLGIHIKGGIFGAYVNNKQQEMNYAIIKAVNIRFFGMESMNGQRTYNRTLFFVLYKAVYDLFGKYKVTLENSVYSGYYFTIRKGKNSLKPNDILAIKNRMKEIILENRPIIRKELPTDQAIKMFEKQGLHAKTKLLKSRGELYTSVYFIDNVVDYYFGYLAPSTGYLNLFDLAPYKKGIILSIPDPCTNFTTVKPFVNQDKMMSSFAASTRWQEGLKIENIGDLNEKVRNGEISDVIKIAEANQEVRIHDAAQKIRKLSKKLRVILIAGPSSSGKTTSAQRLGIHLNVLGIKSVKISLDDYFVDRELTPRDKHGDYDFEALEAIDIKFFNEQLLDLLAGKEIEIPKFDFITGKRCFDGSKLKIGKRDMVIIEGIHGLNPNLTPYVDSKLIFKMYVSALTTISIDGHNSIPTTDNRLIRRIVRDNLFRGYSATDTIRRWEKVREGEDKYIFPYQENADFMFNSALIYELGVFKPFVLPVLAKVYETEPEYSEAQRLLKFISYFESIDSKEIPPTSLMKEFLGGSSFKY